MPVADPRQSGSAYLKLVVASLLIVLLLAAAVWRADRFMRSMSVAAGTAKDLQQAKPDAKTKIVMEVTDSDATGLIRGILLEKKTEEQYVRTKTELTAQSSANTKMVMGKREDVHKGAVVHITGNLRSDGKLEAEQIVILTGYVKVQ